MKLNPVEDNDFLINRYATESGLWEIGIAKHYPFRYRIEATKWDHPNCPSLVCSYCAGQNGYKPDTWTVNEAKERGCTRHSLPSGAPLAAIIQSAMIKILSYYDEDIDSVTMNRLLPQCYRKPIQLDPCLDQLFDFMEHLADKGDPLKPPHLAFSLR